MSRQTILVFDSGFGGLTVHAEIRKVLPGAAYVYLADDAAFPYGPKPAAELIRRVVDVIGAAIARHRPDIVVIACNTASTICLPALRAAFAVPFVGTVPAVKPAAALSTTKMISVLGTPGTVTREYTHDLIIAHAPDCRVNLVGAVNLARLADVYLAGGEVADADVLAEIAPCFRDRDGIRTDAVVLACTHYPLLVDVYERIAPWPVSWVDPAPAIARRVVSLIGEASGESRTGMLLFTSGRESDPSLAAALSVRGLAVDTSFPAMLHAA
jgi:glutamate racemase